MPRRDLSHWPTSSQTIRTRTLSIAPRDGSSTWWSATLTCVSSNQNSSSSLSTRNAIRHRRSKFPTSHRLLREIWKKKNWRRAVAINKQTELFELSGKLVDPRHFHASAIKCSNFGIVVSSRYGRAALWYYYYISPSFFLSLVSFGTDGSDSQWWETGRCNSTQSFSISFPFHSIYIGKRKQRWLPRSGPQTENGRILLQSPTLRPHRCCCLMFSPSPSISTKRKRKTNSGKLCSHRG